MHITYVSHARFPTEKAHGKQIAEVCTALARLGHTVDLLCPTIRNTIHVSGHEYYGLDAAFGMKYLHNFDATAKWWIPGPLRFLLTMLSYRQAVKRYLKHRPTDVVYLRSPLLLSAALSCQAPVILELHSIPKKARSVLVSQCQQCAVIVCLTSLMADELVSLGVDRDRIVVEGDGVDVHRFDTVRPRDAVREQYDLPKKRIVVGYIGSLVTQNTIEKGVRELIDAIALLKKDRDDVFGWVVGGPVSWQRKYQQYIREIGLSAVDVRMQERIAAADVASAMCACDVLVYPAPSVEHPFFLRYTSPLKLFEYFAANKPIVCADIPPIRDVVNEDAVEFCVPGDANSMAEALHNAIERDSNAQSAERLKLADAYSWENRMQRILDSVTLSS